MDELTPVTGSVLLYAAASLADMDTLAWDKQVLPPGLCSYSRGPWSVATIN